MMGGSIKKGVRLQVMLRGERRKIVPKLREFWVLVINVSALFL